MDAYISSVFTILHPFLRPAAGTFFHTCSIISEKRGIVKGKCAILPAPIQKNAKKEEAASQNE
jgi:hypothetical protein